MEGGGWQGEEEEGGREGGERKERRKGRRKGGQLQVYLMSESLFKCMFFSSPLPFHLPPFTESSEGGRGGGGGRKGGAWSAKGGGEQRNVPRCFVLRGHVETRGGGGVG